MSALADVLRLTSRFMETKDPADFKAWSDANEILMMTPEETEQVGGGVDIVKDYGCPDIVGNY